MTGRLYHGYALPFAVRYGLRPVFNVNRSVIVDVRLRQPTVAALSGITEALARFCSLAATGAMCGAGLSPSASMVDLLVGPPDDTGRVAAALQHCRLDDGALIVLCDLLAHNNVRDNVASLTVDNGEQLQALAHSPNAGNPYPGLARSLPFTFDDEEPEGGGIMFRIQLERAVVHTDMERLRHLGDPA